MTKDLKNMWDLFVQNFQAKNLPHQVLLKYNLLFDPYLYIIDNKYLNQHNLIPFMGENIELKLL